MPDFKIVNNRNEINFNDEWIGSNGQTVVADYAGRRYKLIKQERKFSEWERLARGLLGAWLIVRSFGRALSSEAVKNLFTKDRESRCFGILIKPPLICDETATDFTFLLPKEMMTREIFSHLDEAELANCLRVSKKWNGLASDKDLWNDLTPKIAFGKKQWTKYFGAIGKVPRLPKDIHEILKSPCPFWPGKKVEETHMLVLIPETIGGKSLTLRTVRELVKAPKEGAAIQYINIRNSIIEEQCNQSPTKSHWVLMTKDVIDRSRNKSYPQQHALIAEFAKRTGIDYEVPNVLDAAICIFMKYISPQQRLVNDRWWTFTGCQQKIGGCRQVVGDFSPARIFVYHDFEHSTVGVAALRKFF